MKDKRTGNAIPDGKGALIAEAVRGTNLGLPETNQRKLPETPGVGKTVLGWSETRLARKLRGFRKSAGTEKGGGY